MIALKSSAIVTTSAALLAVVLYPSSLVQQASALAPPPTPKTPAPPAGSGDGRSGYLAAPPGSETLTATLAANSIQLYEQDDFEGSEATVLDLTTAFPAGGINQLPAGLADSLTSIRWNLEPGVVVVFYEDGTAKGEQIALWGKGQTKSVTKWDFNDKASRWAWYDVGGGTAGHSASASAAPHGAEALNAVLPANCLQLFRDQKFQHDMEQIAPVTAVAHGARHKLPESISDSLSSLRWKLPPGVIVMLHQDADGEKQQATVWGEGQLPDLDRWDFNDKVSRWTWAYIGSPQRDQPRTP